jgi:hypothetical protein
MMPNTSPNTLDATVPVVPVPVSAPGQIQNRPYWSLRLDLVKLLRHPLPDDVEAYSGSTDDDLSDLAVIDLAVIAQT